MPQIKLVLNDIDGVFGKFKKPDYPAQQEIEPYKQGLDAIKNVIAEHLQKGVVHGACTGRAFHSIEPVMIHTGINAPSVFEHGTWIWIPGKGGYRLVDKEFPNLIEISNQLESWIRSFDDKQLFSHFPNVDMIRRRHENTHILTYEFLGATAAQVYEQLEKLMPQHIRDGIANGALRKILSESEIDGKPTGAIDIMPNVHKDQGVKHVIKLMGLQKEDVLGIEDSFHSGIPLLQECGQVAGPGNAQDKLKDYIKQRGGFIASQNYADGWVEIMKHFFS